MRAAPAPLLDRDLLRSAGEHLGTLAEDARERWEMSSPRFVIHRKGLYDRYARLARLSREVLAEVDR